MTVSVCLTGEVIWIVPDVEARLRSPVPDAVSVIGLLPVELMDTLCPVMPIGILEVMFETLLMLLLNIFTSLLKSILLPAPAVSSTSPVVLVSRTPPPAVIDMLPVDAVVRVRLFAPVLLRAIPCPARVSEDEDDTPLALLMEKLERFTF